MDIFEYAKKYGKYSFEEEAFNEIDNAVFSSLSYINFLDIVSSNIFNKITVKEAADKYFLRYKDDATYILGVKYARKLLKMIKNTKRYGNLYLYNYVYEARDDQQFSAITIELNKELVYVSFEGTDHLVSGWKEDFMAAYMFPIRSQRMAIKYINKNFFFSNKRIILGGHSKGGNLAMVAGMYANYFIRNKVVKIYSNDGFGLLKEQFESKNYSYVKDKLVHFMPEFSLVGLLLYHEDNHIVVSSSEKGPIEHDLHTWLVDDKTFVRGELNSFCKALDDEIMIWLDKYDNTERERLVLSLFDIFDRAKIDSLIDIMDNKKLIFNLIKESKELTEEDRDMLKDFIGMLFNSFTEVKKEEIVDFFEDKFKNR